MKIASPYLRKKHFKSIYLFCFGLTLLCVIFIVYHQMRKQLKNENTSLLHIYSDADNKSWKDLHNLRVAIAKEKLSGAGGTDIKKVLSNIDIVNTVQSGELDKDVVISGQIINHNLLPHLIKVHVDYLDNSGKIVKSITSDNIEVLSDLPVNFSTKPTIINDVTNNYKTYKTSITLDS